MGDKKKARKVWQVKGEGEVIWNQKQQKAPGKKPVYPVARLIIESADIMQVDENNHGKNTW